MAKTATREIHRDSDPLFSGTHKGGHYEFIVVYDSDGQQVYDSEGEPVYAASDTTSPSSVLQDRGACFRSLGVNPEFELYCENETRGTGGTVTAATEDSVTVSGVTWYYGDTYNIYKTSTKNSFISAIWCDVSRGQKIEHPKDVNKDGWRWEDIDRDDHGRKNVWGPGQPERQ